MQAQKACHNEDHIEFIKTPKHCSTLEAFMKFAKENGRCHVHEGKTYFEKLREKPIQYNQNKEVKKTLISEETSSIC